MANTVQAKKRARQGENHRSRNVSDRSMMRTYIKKVVNTIQTGNLEQAQAAYKEAVPIIDHMATKGIIHKNKAARHKSRLNTRIHTMSSLQQTQGAA